MKKHIMSFVIGLILLAGGGLLAYPSVSNYVNEKNSSRAIATYQDAVGELGEADYSKELNEAQEYNIRLAQSYTNLASAVSAETERADNPYENLLNVGGTGVMGEIKIPVIHVDLPIYHGTDEGVLQIGVGHLKGSSLPVGGTGTHAVLSGHRGLPSAKLFTDLDRLQTGDVFYLRVLGEILEYQIDQIEVVLPEKLDQIEIDPERDLVTLVTCTPYGVNSHRILIRGARIDYDGKIDETVAMRGAVENEDPLLAGQSVQGLTLWQKAGIAIGLLALAVLVGFMIPVKPKNKQNVQNTKNIQNIQKIQKTQKQDEGKEENEPK
ncbi:class C sortase [Brotaphodocola sp.]|uniref:class C sortase n=1 Tax=Brotaphodocola sp. TaxID=3073577 RepID=UPI003D7E6E28